MATCVHATVFYLEGLQFFYFVYIIYFALQALLMNSDFTIPFKIQKPNYIFTMPSNFPETNKVLGTLELIFALVQAFLVWRSCFYCDVDMFENIGSFFDIQEMTRQIPLRLRAVDKPILEFLFSA